MRAPWNTRWAILVVGILLSFASGLPTTTSLDSSISVIRSDSIVATFGRRMFGLWKLTTRTVNEANSATRFESGETEKLSTHCTTLPCHPGHSILSPSIDSIGAAHDISSQSTEETSLKMVDKAHGHVLRTVKRNDPEGQDLNFTYVPPPQTDITAELLAESLAVQPQNTATVGSIVPHFPQGVISFGVQLNGLIAATMVLNGSTSLPCDSIGSSPEPNLVLGPANIINATAVPVIPDCEIIAVNMYSPLVVQYWVQKHDGSIFSLAGSNKVQNIGATNTSAGASLVLRVQQSSQSKRGEGKNCDQECPNMIMQRALARRAISPADSHTSTFSEEACAAIVCNNNGGKPALFNPFTRTCGCADPILVEIDHSGN